ncbi:MAG: glycosyltransferase family 2 protein [Bdellovibrionales bacterium]|nr:glycosyltransferase family 2 protein [Bdellovibrionales bacterium]
MRMLFVIPAYNEADNIGKCIELLDNIQTPAEVLQIIVVDDGSVDGTASIAESCAGQHPVRVVKHETNYGVGQAFRTGFAAALELAEDEDIIATIEADNTGDFDILPEMVRQIQNGADLALASCYAAGGKIVDSTPLRLILSKTANLLLRIFYPTLRVHTFSSFYRVYRASLLKAALARHGEHFIEQDGFECMVEVLIKLSRMTENIVEVPMTLQAGERIGRSKMRICKTIVGYGQFMARDTLNRLQGKG